VDITKWLDLQPQLLAKDLSRIEIAKHLSRTDLAEIRVNATIRVWRNYTAEPMQPMLELVSRFWGVQPTVNFQNYDDSFTFATWDRSMSSDSHVVLVDRHRYEMSDSEFNTWISDRVRRLTDLQRQHPVVVTISDTIKFQVNGEEIGEYTVDKLGTPISNSRYERLTGSRLTPSAHNAIARELAGSWAFEFFVPPKKLLVTDLDNTLHRGVLGEIGMNVVVDSAALDLQKELLDARKAGFLLAVISKNDIRDVQEVLQRHPSYVLMEQDFVAIEANWLDKPSNLEKILRKTRVGPDSVVFIDDNIVELLQMNAVHPDVSLIVAGDDVPSATIMRNMPGYRRSVKDRMGEVRSGDLQSNARREELIKDGLREYYESAAPILTILDGRGEHQARIADLGRRSNQFNLTLARSKESDYGLNRRQAVALGVRDSFSDSGIVGGILAEADQDGVARIVELFLSCRILGRQLETPLLAMGIQSCLEQLDAESVSIPWIIGDRNEPALDWLTTLFLEERPSDAGSITVTRSRIAELAIVPDGVSVEKSI
jgi:FkbH-like protein